MIRQVKQRDIDYEDLTQVDHLVRDVLAGRRRPLPRPARRWRRSSPPATTAALGGHRSAGA